MSPEENVAQTPAKEPVLPVSFASTAEVPVPERTVDQVVGQESSVDLIVKAAAQKRHVLLVGVPGTGKSMLAQAMSEILPVSALSDVLIYPNNVDPNNPRVRMLRAGKGKDILHAARVSAQKEEDNARIIQFVLPLVWMIGSFLLWHFKFISDVIFAATLLLAGVMLIGLNLSSQMRSRETRRTPKLLVDNSNKKTAPFVEATGARAGALLGDVRHDPLQSGGLGTPPHLRVEPGMIHRASGGVLFIDEIATLSEKSQQELLTAMQEKKYSITGQSDLSSGAMTRTAPVPCDFVLVAAGNYDDLQRVHPALRSRIRGYGYELYMNQDMPDTPENRTKIVQFIAQEVKKDAKIPHFSPGAVEEIIFEARKRAQRKNRLTLKLRDLGGLVRAAGDIAKEKKHALVLAEDVYQAKLAARTFEQQMVDKMLEVKKDYDIFLTQGAAVGRVNGLAVLADGASGLVLPIEAQMAPALSRNEGRVIATGKLGEIAKEAVQNVSGLIKKISGKDVSQMDLHIQFLQTYEGVEGDSASVSVATAVISAIENIPVRQDLAMTGSLSVRGEVLPVGGVSGKVHAAVLAGFKTVVIPKTNVPDVVLPEDELKQIQIVPATTLSDVLDVALVSEERKTSFLSTFQKVLDMIPTWHPGAPASQS